MKPRGACFGVRGVGLLLGLAVAAVTLMSAGEASAYAWMIRHGYAGCATCHVSPSGGGQLNLYGRAQGDLLLRMRYGSAGEGQGDDGGGEAAQDDGFGDDFASDDFDSDDFGDDSEADEKAKKKPPKKKQPEPERYVPVTGFLWGLAETPDWLLLGGSYRHAMLIKFGDETNIRTFPMQADLYAAVQVGKFRSAASIGFNRVGLGVPHGRRAQITGDQGDGMNLVSRTHWVGYEFGGGRYLLRAGRMNLPFGLRIPEHTMWVREATATDAESDQHHGVAFAYSAAKLRAEIMGIAGNFQVSPDDFRERGYSGYVEYLPVSWASIGASSRLTHAAADIDTGAPRGTLRQAHGVFSRIVPVKPLVLMAEADVLLKSRRAVGYVGYLQADWEIIQGLHVLGTGELLDAGKIQEPEGVDAVVGAGKPALGGWLTLDWFFWRQMELRLDAIYRQEDDLTLFGQLHFYL